MPACNFTITDRRNFIKTAGAVSAAVGLFSMARIGKADELTEITWDYEADLAMVGGGGAGFSAGIEAADAECSVLVLEKGGVCLEKQSLRSHPITEADIARRSSPIMTDVS